MYQIIKAYRNQPQLRLSFNQLAKEIYDLDFEGWYQNGFWQEQYLPYSVIQDGRIIANVSVNLTNMSFNEKKYRFIQLGTVMTKESFRKQGLIRLLLAEVEKDFAGKTDGIYLFANDSVLDFYPKFGFERAEEYQYFKDLEPSANRTIRQIPMNDKKDWAQMCTVLNTRNCYGNLVLSENTGLYMFYLSQFMQENVYYEEKTDTYVIAEIQEDTLFLHAIFPGKTASVTELAQTFGGTIRKLVLCFTPKNPEAFQCRRFQEEDTTLFIKGAALKQILSQKVMFQALAHA